MKVKNVNTLEIKGLRERSVLINNTTILKLLNDTPLITQEQDSCIRGLNTLDSECILRTFCPQLSRWYIHTGIIIIVTYLLLSWLLWAFLKYWYKYLPNRSLYILGNLHILETRIYWDTWVRARISKLMLGYIIVVVYLNR